MSFTYHCGQRVSFKNQICTIRYIGPIEGTDKQWLGVEWDDPQRGKHYGAHKGIRYFTCLNPSQTPGSFIAQTQAKDLEQSFVEAVEKKYATDTIISDDPVVISGKIVEKVGFEKIRRQQAQLTALKVVVVDGFRINKAIDSGSSIHAICPNIQTLDLSRNLFETFDQIIEICRNLEHLRILRLNGNRLRLLPGEVENARGAFDQVQEFELDDTLLPWEDICQIAGQYPSLKKLTASSNFYTTLRYSSAATSIFALPLTSLTLEYNNFMCLTNLELLTQLHSLKELLLKGNKISKIPEEWPIFGSELHYVDLSYNQISSWTFVDQLPTAFSGMTALRLSGNPIYESLTKGTNSGPSNDDAFLLTLARIGQLKSLNFSDISTEVRKNAEMYYLAKIGQEIAQVSADEEKSVTSQHKRYDELCELYGSPTVVRKSAAVIHPDFLEARLIKFTFYMPLNTKLGQVQTITKVQEIPKGFDIYRLKGIVGTLFDVMPLKTRLTWETGEIDPVAGFEEIEEDSDDEETRETTDEAADHPNVVSSKDAGKWIKREVEVRDSLKQIGVIVDGMEATIRVELQK